MMMPEPDVPKQSRRSALLEGLEDRFGVLLTASLVALLIIGLIGDSRVARVINPLLLVGLFFLSLVISQASRRTVLMWTAIIPVATAAAIVAGVYGTGPFAITVSTLSSVVLGLACVITVGVRVSRHRQISMHTVLGSLCIYFFIALLFAQLYRALDVLGESPLFAQGPADSLDYVYFSFVSITTLGFGDLSPASELGKMAAIIEAMLGQLFLVTVVALFVGNLGSRRPRSPE